MKNYETANLKNLYLKRPWKRLRLSSYDRTGGNDDFLCIAPGETITFGEIRGTGVINHFWCTLANAASVGSIGHEKFNVRKVILRVYWDNEENPSIQLTNECNSELRYYFYIDYEAVPELPEDTLYFHAIWNRECPTEGVPHNERSSHTEWCFGGDQDKNITGDGNYVLLDAIGSGQYVGCNINNLVERRNRM